MEFIGDNALVVTLTGKIIRIDHVSNRSRDHSH